jgi:hypothetical protein
MKKMNWISNSIIAITLIGRSALAADGQVHPITPPVTDPHFYHLVFVVKEIEAGKVINSRSYFMSIEAQASYGVNSYNRSIRTGTKVPVPVQLGTKIAVETSPGIQTAVDAQPGQITYVDVGVNIDCRNPVDLGPKLAMELSAEVSSVKEQVDDHSKGQTIGNPLIQQSKWNSEVVVALGTPTVVFSSDEVTSKRTLELELTATEIK